KKKREEVERKQREIEQQKELELAAIRKKQEEQETRRKQLVNQAIIMDAHRANPAAHKVISLNVGGTQFFTSEDLLIHSNSPLFQVIMENKEENLLNGSVF